MMRANRINFAKGGGVLRPTDKIFSLSRRLNRTVQQTVASQAHHRGVREIFGKKIAISLSFVTHFARQTLT